MSTIIDLGEEILVDRTTVHVHEYLLLLTALGRPLARGSAWMVVRKDLADHYALPMQPGTPIQNYAC